MDHARGLKTMTRSGRWLLLLLGVALAIRVGAAVGWQHRMGPGCAFGDSQSYWSLARAIAAGEPYRYGSLDSAAFRTPGYPMLLAPLFLAAGDNPPILAARLVGAVLGTLATAGVWWLGRTLFSPAAGWVAGGVAAVYPGAVVPSVLVLSEAAFAPLWVAQWMLWVKAWQAGSLRATVCWGLAAGVAAGAATLVRPGWLLFVPFAALVGVAFGPRRRRQVGLAVVIAMGLVVVMAPWWVRNARVLGRPVLTTTQLGASLYDGLNPAADGSSRMQFVDAFVEEELSKRPADGDEPLELRLDRRLREAALEWAGKHPAATTRLAGVKLLRMWNVWPNEPSLSSGAIRAVVAAGYVPVLLLGVWGAVRTIRSGWPYVLCWLPAVYLTGIHVVFVSSIRYREPAMLGLVVLAAGAVVAWAPRGPSVGLKGLSHQ